MTDTAACLEERLEQARAAWRGGDLARADALAGEVLAADPLNYNAVRLVAYARLHLERYEAAMDACAHGLSRHPGDAELNNILGVTLQRVGRLADSVAPLAEAARAGGAEPAFNLGVALQHLGRLEDAISAYDIALGADPNFASAQGNLALVLSRVGRLDESLIRYHHAVTLDPGNPFTRSDRGVLFERLGRPADALADFEAALALRPDLPVLWFNHGCALGHLGRYDQATDSYDRALALNPAYVDALGNRGVALHKQRRFDEALQSLEAALAINPDAVVALKNRGVTLTTLGRFNEAVADLERARAISPADPEIHYNLGVALSDLKRNDQALAAYDQAISLRPTYLEAINNRGMALLDLGRYDEALASYEQAMAADPEGRLGVCGAALCAIRLCDWDRRERYSALLARQVAAGDKDVAPFALLCYGEPPAVQLKGAENYLFGKIPVMPAPLWTGERYNNPKIKVAYLSADYRRHPMGHLTVQLFELHDRARFEIHAISFSTDDKGEVRRRIEDGADAFHDVSQLTDPQAAALIRSLNIDIAVDLMAHTQHARPAILAHRPAPVQVNYLGYPATMGGDFTDYILADPIVLPLSEQPFYSETIVHLPGCYQANDSKRPISDWKPTRAELGLPDEGFVFCCFNNTWKMTRDIFEVWMRLLNAVPGSVLWLYRDHEEAARNLKAAAAARGVDPARIVFAPPVRLEDHLARHRAADLFLDTLPYNAHTTGSDTLWAGLPIVTAKGNTFAGRVAASLLTNVGLPELITETLEDYEALALALATDPERLAKLRAKLARVRDTSALFDTPRFTRGLEAAYEGMVRK